MTPVDPRDARIAELEGLLKSALERIHLLTGRVADLERRLGERPANQRIFRAYLLKEGLADVLRRRQPGVATRELARWCNWASRSRLKPFVKLARTIKQFSAGILAYIRAGLTLASSSSPARTSRNSMVGATRRLPVRTHASARVS